MRKLQFKQRLYEHRKKVMTSLLIILCISAFSNRTLLVNAFTPTKKAPAYTTQITAHRGNVTTAVENTLPAIEIASNEQADYAEIDVQQSKDGQLFVFHDPTFNRMAGLNKKTSELTYKEISKLNLNYYSKGKLKGTKIPLFEEVIFLAKEKNLKLNVEIKSNADSAIMARQTVTMIKQFNYGQACIITSANPSVLEHVEELDSTMKTGLITSSVPDLQNLKSDILSIQEKVVTKEVIDEAHSYGIEVHVWTVNNKEDVKKLVQMGADNIITDEVTNVQNALSSLN